MALQPSDRRTVLTTVGATATGLLAGCLGGDSPDETGQGSTDGATTTGDESTDESAATDDESTDSPQVDWEEVPEFRLWLTDGVMETNMETNQRFEYASVFDETYYASARTEALDLDTDVIDGHLLRGSTVVHFGSFDRTAITEGFESEDGWAVDEEYHGYAVAESEESQITIGDEAVIVGTGYEPLIDARRGERDRLEEQDPTFTRLLERLPDGDVIVGQYDSPTGGQVDVDEIHLWGLSQEEISGGTATWLFYFEDEADLTEDVLGELEAIVPDVDGASLEGSERDGRVARVDAELPDFEDV